MLKNKFALFLFYILGFMTHYIISKTMRNEDKGSPSRNISSVGTQTDYKKEQKSSQASCKILEDSREILEDSREILEDSREILEDSREILESENYDLEDEMDESYNSDCSSYYIKYEEDDDYKNNSSCEDMSYFQKLKDFVKKKKENHAIQVNDDLELINEINDNKINDNKVNDNKVNNTEINDDKIKDDKINDDKVNDDKINDDKINDDKINDDKSLKDELINPILFSLDASTQTDTVINSEVQTSKHLKLIRKVSRDSRLRSYVEDSLFTLVCKAEDRDYPFIFSLIPEYIKSGVIFLPQNNILTEILKKGIIPDQEYSSTVFKMGYRKLYTVLCTFLYCKEQFNALDLICKVEHRKNISSEDIIVTLSNIKKSFKLGQDNIVRFLKCGKFLEQLYHPMTPEQILNYKFNNPVDKDIFMNNNIMKEMDTKILVSNGKNLEISILDYLIISFDKVNNKI